MQDQDHLDAAQDTDFPEEGLPLLLQNVLTCARERLVSTRRCPALITNFREDGLGVEVRSLGLRVLLI
jgi:hypothetical protein